MDSVCDSKSFYETILRSNTNTDLTVSQVSKELATSKGDNFLSEIYRIFINYTDNGSDNETHENTSLVTRETSLIFKMKLGTVSMSESIDKVFFTESNVYKGIISKIESRLNCSIAPKIFHIDENSNFIVMEDLIRSGYFVPDKLKGLTFHECRKVIEKMAQLHAGSVFIAETEPQLLEFYKICPWETFPKAFFKFMKDSLTRISGNIAEKWKEEEYQTIACKLTKFIDNFETKVSSAFKYREDEFCVLNHGDFWINNIMMKQNEKGEPIDALMIDFQLVAYTSPAIDLQHFFAMCPELAVKGEKDEYLLENYLIVLTREMRKLGCKTQPPSIRDLQKAMKSRGIHSVITGLIFYPGVHANSENIEDFTEVMSEGETNVDVFKNASAVEIIRKFSRIINNKGYLD